MTFTKIGQEFQVNTYTNDRQEEASITALKDGGFVVTWQSSGQDDGDQSWEYGIYGQRYDSSGNAVGDEFQVNTYTAEDQDYPSVTGLEDGSFVVVWESSGQDGSNTGIYGQRYDSNGVAQGDEFLVNTYTSFGQRLPSITGLNGGGFVAVWDTTYRQEGDGYSGGISGRRYDSNGVPVGGEFPVNTYTYRSQDSAVVTGLNNGGFVIVWQSSGQDEGDQNWEYGIYGQRYDSDGIAQGEEFQINTSTESDQQSPSVTGLKNGGFIVTWASNKRIYGQRYDSDGVALGTEFQINTHDMNYSGKLSVTALNHGGFLVTWTSTPNPLGDSEGVSGQEFDENGVAIGDEFLINSYTSLGQHSPSVTTLNDDSVVVVWQSSHQDDSFSGVYGQRFGSDVDESVIDGGSWYSGTWTTPPEGLTNIGTLTIGGSGTEDKYLDGQLNNNGTIIENHNYFLDLQFVDGAIINNSGTYEFQRGDITLNYGDSGTINNSSIFTKTTSGEANIIPTFNNFYDNQTGTVNVEAGKLVLAGGGTSGGGDFSISEDATLEFTELENDETPNTYLLNNGSQITGEGNLVISGDTLDVKLSEGVAIANTLQLSVTGGTLQLDDDWTLPTVTNWNGGTLRSSGIITNNNSLSIGGTPGNGDDKYLEGQLNNNGNIIENHDYLLQLYFADGAILNNSGNYEFQKGDIILSYGDSGEINNSGTFTKTTSDTATIAPTFNNFQGEQTGTVNVEAGVLALAGGGTSDGGDFTISNDSTLAFGTLEQDEDSPQDYILNNGSQITGTGDLLVSGGTLDVKVSEGVTIANTLELSLTRGTLQLDDDWTLPTVSNWNGGTLKSSGIITNNNSLSIGGTFGNGGDKYLDGQLDNNGNIIENHEYLLQLQFADGAILNNSGNYEFQKGDIILSYGDSGEINNSGTFTKTTSGTATIAPTFNNFQGTATGSVNVEAGILALAGGGTSDGGDFTISNDSTLAFGTLEQDEDSPQDYILNNGSQITGTGDLLVSGGTLDVKVSEGVTIANTLELSLTRGTLKLDDDWTLPTVTNWNGGTLKNSGIITNNNSLSIGGTPGNGGDKYLDGQLDNNGNIIENHHYLLQLHFANGAILNNSGNYEFQKGDIILSDSSGTINNSGIFYKTTSGEGNISPTFNNTGTLEAQAGTLNLNGTYTHNNAHIILKGGDINFSNTLNINGGSIEGNGDINVDVNNSGLLNPRHFNNTEFGRLEIQGNYTDTNTANIDIQIGGSNAGVNFDQIDINGGVDVHSTLNASLNDGFSPNIGDRFEVINYNSITHLSQFQFTGLDIPNNRLLLPEYWDDQLTLTVTEKPLDPVLNVTTNQDIVNDNDGVLSLREAIIAFNRTPFDNTIILGEDTYTLELTGKFENFAKTGDLDILPRGGHLTIKGQGEDEQGEYKTILDAASIDRFFEIHQGASLTLSGVKITRGKPTSGSSEVPDFGYEIIDYGDGGAILNAGTLNLSDSELFDNQSTEGGAIFNSGTLNLSNSEFVNNQVIGSDGGSGIDGDDAKGGAIYNEGQLEVTNSSFSGNRAEAGNGGDGSDGADGLSAVGLGATSGKRGQDGGNGGDAQGGAIYNSGELIIFDTTFSDNHVTGGDAGNGGDGGKGGSALTFNLGLNGGDGGDGGNGGNALEPVIFGVQDLSRIIDNNNIAIDNNHTYTVGIGGKAGIGGEPGNGAERGDRGLDGIDGINGEGRDSSSSSNNFTFDIDGDGQYSANIDGLLLYGYLNIRGIGVPALVNNLTQQLADNLINPDSNAIRTTGEQISDYLESNINYLDIDGNGDVSANIDGLLTYGYFKIRGIGVPALINNLTQQLADNLIPDDSGATRTDATDIIDYFNNYFI